MTFCADSEAGPEASGPPILDRERLAMIMEESGDYPGELLRELLDLFQDDLITMQAAFNRALETGDVNAAIHAAHGIAGGAASLAGLRLSRVCLSVENHLEKTGDLEFLRERLPEIGRECKNLISALGRELQALE